MAFPDLAKHLVRTVTGEPSVDFTRPDAVRALNAALLRQQYGIRHWELPAGYLCPPVPGRADYVHGLADLLAGDNDGIIPRGGQVRGLDIGVGANVIYPLLGHVEYGWHFVGTDIDARALDIARRNVAGNPGFAAAIELRLQTQSDRLFAGVVKPGECFDLTLCNPPFHASAADAQQGTQRKWRNLGKPAPARSKGGLNFGGQPNELWCAGGEAAFLRRMIDESIGFGEAIGWFSSLVAKSEHLRALRKQLQRIGAREVREIAMAQGSKQSRFLAWTFLDGPRRREGSRRRWQPAGRSGSDAIRPEDR